MVAYNTWGRAREDGLAWPAPFAALTGDARVAVGGARAPFGPASNTWGQETRRQDLYGWVIYSLGKVLYVRLGRGVVRAPTVVADILRVGRRVELEEKQVKR